TTKTFSRNCWILLISAGEITLRHGCLASTRTTHTDAIRNPRSALNSHFTIIIKTNWKKNKGDHSKEIRCHRYRFQCREASHSHDYGAAGKGSYLQKNLSCKGSNPPWGRRFSSQADLGREHYQDDRYHSG